MDVVEMFRREGMLKQRGGNCILIDRLPMRTGKVPHNFQRWQVMDLKQGKVKTFSDFYEANHELARREGRTIKIAA